MELVNIDFCEYRRHVHPLLKEVEISGFRNTKAGVALALSLIRNAIALEKMTLKWEWDKESKATKSGQIHEYVRVILLKEIADSD
ncbi:F-box/LRR-repeat protein [Corchorus capsularis]|uniref:F-box/LRR-repeat protein n=1 Tax=Corchorus capsularis TaxID=210143 RepID=A0A1R3GCN0_COCAP|nr:F-box/LRR-repeat protein [Corchorus capsularis]